MERVIHTSKAIMVKIHDINYVKFKFSCKQTNNKGIMRMLGIVIWTCKRRYRDRFVSVICTSFCPSNRSLPGLSVFSFLTYILYVSIRKIRGSSSKKNSQNYAEQRRLLYACANNWGNQVVAVHILLGHNWLDVRGMVGWDRSVVNREQRSDK